MKNFIWTIIFLICPTIALSELTVPERYELIRERTGVKIFNNNQHYVQVIDLQQGAYVKLLYGNPSNIEADPSQCSDDYIFNRKALNDFWNDMTQSSNNAFSVINGTFFSTNDFPTPLAFSLKVDNSIKACGYEDSYPDDMILLELNGDSTVEVTNAYLSRVRIKNVNAAENIVGGLSQEAYVTGNIPRTFIGTIDENIIVILSTSRATRAIAAGILSEFGVVETDIIMFDGGGSTQLIYDGIPAIRSSRTIPQAIAVFSGGDISVYEFRRKADPLYASYDTGEDNFDAQFKVRNNSSSSVLIDDMAIAITQDGYHLFYCWTKSSPTTLNPNDFFATEIQYCEIWEGGNYAVEAKLQIDGQWITYETLPPFYVRNRADVNDDDRVNLTDAMFILRKSLGLSMSETGWFYGENTGDVNCDNDVTLTDAMFTLRYSLGLSMIGTSWCAEPLAEIE